jgi:hypothetical protein
VVPVDARSEVAIGDAAPPVIVALSPAPRELSVSLAAVDGVSRRVVPLLVSRAPSAETRIASVLATLTGSVVPTTLPYGAAAAQWSLSLPFSEASASLVFRGVDERAQLLVNASNATWGQLIGTGDPPIGTLVVPVRVVVEDGVALANFAVAIDRAPPSPTALRSLEVS